MPDFKKQSLTNICLFHSVSLFPFLFPAVSRLSLSRLYYVCLHVIYINWSWWWWHSPFASCVSGENPKSMQWYSHSLAFLLWGSPSLLKGKSLMLSLLSVVVPEYNNCTAFLCFPHLPPLSRLKATDFVWLYKMGWDIHPSAFLVDAFVWFLLCSSLCGKILYQCGIITTFMLYNTYIHIQHFHCGVL